MNGPVPQIQLGEDQASTLANVLADPDGDVILTQQGDGSLIVGFVNQTIEITTAGTVFQAA